MARRATPSIHLLVGGIDMTYEAENLTWSSSDPGGYEMASFSVQVDQANQISPGMSVIIRDGMQTLWVGRVSEPAKQIKHSWNSNRKTGAITTRISCEGAGAALKDNNMSMVYVDRDISRWSDPSVTRQLGLASTDYQLGTSQVGADPTSGTPALVQQITDSWASPFKPLNESWYDPGTGNLIGKIYYNMLIGNQEGPSDANWFQTVNIAPDANASTSLGSGNLHTVSGGNPAAYFSPSVQWRFGFIQHYYNVTPAGGQGASYVTTWRALTVYGNHNLVGRGGDPVGFYASDIAAHAAQLAIIAGADMKLGQIDVVDNYIIPHYVQYDPVAHDTVEQDMARIGPAHYGVWASDSIFDDTPAFTFRNYGTGATVFCSLSDCDEADVSQRLSNLYTSAEITYQDAAGTQFVTEVTLPNDLLNLVGIRRTTLVDLGLSSAAAAQTFSEFALQALYAQARTAGTIQVTNPLRDAGGSPFPAYWLRAGLDRLRINDLAQHSSIVSGSDIDSMRISRIESQMNQASGEVTSRIELDAGPNLIETLQSRLQIADQLVGF